MQKEWEASLATKPKLRTYIKFKRVFEVEKYMKVYLTRTQRSLLAQFRLGILPLHVETGRFRGVPLNNRVCNMCTDLFIEDEFHFLCICDFNGDLRQNMYRKVCEAYPLFLHQSNEEKFIYI